MKTILVGVDFTKSSENTINYAIELAKQSKSKIFLFYGLMAPVVHTTSGLVFIEGETILKDASKMMKVLQANLSTNNPTIKFEYEVTYDNIKEKIKTLASKKKISTAVLGLESKSKVSRLFYGTSSADISGKINCPVITVPERYKKQTLKKVIVAIDNKENINAGLSRRIHLFLKSVGAKADYVHVITDDELQLGLKNTQPFPITNIKSKDFLKGISVYSKKAKADAILLLSHNYNFFQSLFIESNSQKAILSCKIPVISIHK